MEKEERLLGRRKFLKFGTAGALGSLLSIPAGKLYNDGTVIAAPYSNVFSSTAPASGSTILDEPIMPILGWAGPSGEMIRDDVMKGMADSGFNLSLSSTGADKAIEALDIAYRNKVRLVLQLREYHVDDDFVFDDAKKNTIKEIVMRIKDHPGLYGYHLRDEPRFFLLDKIAEVYDFIRSLDPYHLCYVNHNPPISQDGLGAGSVELFWKEFIRKTKPQILSYDHYPLQIGSDDQIKELGPGAPNVFGKIVVKPDYFEALDIVRNFSNFYNIPMWVFTLSVKVGAHPSPTEGHMRFQLMCNLAYGARGLQCFTYAYSEAMVRKNGSTTPEWEIARRINNDVHILWKKMKDLRSIAVYHTGPLWSGTRSLKKSDRPGTLNCTGDPAVIGIFDDPKGNIYAFIVNKNPVEWGRVNIEANIKEGDLLYYDLETEQMHTRWPYNIKNLPVALAPGESILFQLGGAKGQGRF